MCVFAELIPSVIDINFSCRLFDYIQDVFQKGIDELFA